MKGNNYDKHTRTGSDSAPSPDACRSQSIPYQDKKELIYSLNAGDVHWCVNAKGIKGVSCPSKAYGIMSAGQPILGVLEKDTEVRWLIEKSGCGKCCDPGDYAEIENLINWYILIGNSEEGKNYGINGRPERTLLGREVIIAPYVENLEPTKASTFMFAFDFSDYIDMLEFEQSNKGCSPINIKFL